MKSYTVSFILIKKKKEYTPQSNEISNDLVVSND